MLLSAYVALYSKIILQKKKTSAKHIVVPRTKKKHYLPPGSGDILEKIFVQIFMICFS